MNQNSVTLDQAILNLEKIIAHVLIEQDLKLKGMQIGQGWDQLKCIKQVIVKMGIFERRKYQIQIQILEKKLGTYEDNYISELEIKLALEDVQKLSDLLNNYKSQLIIDRKKDIKEKMEFLASELQRIVKKNQHRTNDEQWVQVLQQSREIIQMINKVLYSKTDGEFKDNQIMMSHMLKTMYVTKRIKEEEEEDLMQIAVQIENLKYLQAAIDLKTSDDGNQLDIAEKQQAKTNQTTEEALGQYKQANQFVQMRRRTKLKLFFQGMFTALGAFGGKIGAAFGLAVGTVVGNKVGKAAINNKVE